jgi:putative transposase
VQVLALSPASQSTSNILRHAARSSAAAGSPYDCCLAALEDALARCGKPEIFNTDQGSQFTGTAFTGALIEAGARISMDGRGRWMDNVFIEGRWRSLKYEDVYLKGYADSREAKAGIGEYFAFHNERRLHRALGYRAPIALWRDGAAPGACCPQTQQQTEPLAA